VSSTNQRTAADAEVPAEHEAPDELGLAEEFDASTRNQSRGPAVEVLAATGREGLPEPVVTALLATGAPGDAIEPLYTAEDVRDLPAAVGVRDWRQAAELALELGAPGLSPRRSR